MLLVGAGLVADVVVATLFALLSEPRYEGKQLSVWLSDWYRPPPAKSPPTAFLEFARKRKEAEVAVRGLGQKAVPDLTRMLWRRDSALKRRIMRYGWAQWLATKPLFIDFLEPAWTKNRTAAQALSLLGPAAKGAVPALIRELESNPDEETRRCASVCLGAIGPDAAAAVPALTRLSIVGSGSLHMSAREALRLIGPARTNGLAVALQYEHSPDLAVQTAASVTLYIVDPGRVYGRGHNAEHEKECS